MLEMFNAYLDNLPMFKTKEEYLEVFELLDFNGNGYLSLAEIDKVVVEKYDKNGYNVPKEALLRAF